MNQIDRENLRFILENHGPALEMWYNNLTEAQRIYASNLLNTYRQELDLKAILVQDPVVTDLNDATHVLNRIRLGL